MATAKGYTEFIVFDLDDEGLIDDIDVVGTQSDCKNWDYAIKVTSPQVTKKAVVLVGSVTL